MYVQSVERSMFKKTEHPRKGGVLGLSPSGDGLLHCQKKKKSLYVGICIDEY